MGYFSYINPPKWCPDALPSARGWVHPTTGELLVSVPGGIPVTEQKTEKPVLKEDNAKPVIDESLEAKEIINETVTGNVIDESQDTQNIIKEGAKTTRRNKAVKENKE